MPRSDNPAKESGVWLTNIKAAAKRAMADYIWGKGEHTKEPTDQKSWKTRADLQREGKWSWGEYD